MIIRRSRYLRRALAPETPRIAIPRSEPSWSPADEVRHPFHCTIRLPKPERDDPGEIALGTYSLSDNGVLRVYDEGGRMLGTGTLKSDDDAVAAARKVMREKRGKHHAFYDPITCRNPPV